MNDTPARKNDSALAITRRGFLKRAVASGAVFVGQRQAAASALGGHADCGQPVQAIQQLSGVDAQGLGHHALTSAALRPTISR